MVRVGVSVIGLGIALLIAAAALAAQRAAFIDVAGAPGDGEQALERALSDRLVDDGFAIKSMPAADAYEIQGTVRLAPATRGKENVRIDWTVFGPEGTRLGNVTQVKEIRKGSLDQHWGAAADAAADAAAHDILKLMDSHKAVGTQLGAP
jgi:hypothetical protein